MELHGDVIIEASRQQVWQALNDPDILSRCIPGCEEVRQLSPTETHVRVALKMGPVRARFVGKILMDDVIADQGCTLHFEGSGGAAGFARGTSKVSLTDQGSATLLAYSASASIGGKLGQVGGRMIDASAKQMADQFFNALQEGFGAASVSAADAIAGTAATAVAASHGTASKLATHSASSSASSFVSPHASSFASPPQRQPSTTTEGIRVLWFALGVMATSVGFALANLLHR